MLPTPSDVAALLRSRTKARLGEDSTGEFSAHTVPTLTDVESMLERAGRLVYTVTGPYAQLSDEWMQGAVLDVIALRAAMDVERSRAPEQQGKGSFHAALTEQFDADLKRIKQALREVPSGGPRAGDGVLPLAVAAPCDPSDLTMREPGEW